MKKLFTLLALALSFACSGEYQDGYDDEAPDGGEEIGSVQQAFVSQVNSGAGDKSITGTNSIGGPCSTGQPSTATCYVPASKTFSLAAINGNCNATDAAKIDTFVTDIVNTLSPLLSPNGWTVTKVSSGATLFANCDTSLPGSGSAVDSYIRWTPVGSGASLTESLPGTFVKNPQFQCKIDVPAIRAFAGATADEEKAMRHALGNCVIKGLGEGNSSLVANFVSSNTLVATNDPNQGLLTAAQLCRVRNYSVSGATTYSTSTSAGCNN